MAIQKINLGTEPLGEGGDTYRSANTKINENFSNTDHAASRLVGLDNANLVQAKDAREATLVWRNRGYVHEDHFDNAEGGEVYYSSTGVKLPSSSHIPEGVTGDFVSRSVLSTEELVMGSGRLRQTLTRTANLFNGIHEIFRLKDGTDGAWTDWVHTLTTANTKKDSRTNLLLKSGDTIPRDSPASRIVGKAKGNIVEVGAFGLGAASPPNFWSTSEELTENSGIWSAGISSNTTRPSFFPANWFATRTNHISFGIDSYPAGFLAQPDGKLAYYMTGSNEIIQSRVHEIYNSGNTIIENGYLKPSSPVLRLSHNDIVKEHEANQLDINVDNPEKGVYKITGTTGLRKNDGWYFSPPKDEHFNILCMVELEEDGDTITVKTYAKKFDFEKVAIVPDYENPVDIIGEVLLRFNDIPQEQLDEPEPVEEPIVDEVEESEVVEEPTEEPSEEVK